MSDYKDDPTSRSSDSVDSREEVEMQEREDDFEEDHLLSRDIVYKEEWHIKTGWAITGSIVGVIAVVLALVFFVKLVIISDSPNKDIGEIKGISSFRRPASEYILDPAWNFNAPNKVREYKWTILDIVGNPDGVFRPLLAINGQFPGPMIECNEGDTIVIVVDNQSVNSTSLHFHGIFQNGTNFMDGATGITQCPIAPKRKFRYEFTVTGQSGTYYYHGNHGVQVSDGLYGPLVIHSKYEKKMQKLDYASDRIVMLQDYYHDSSSGLLAENLKPGNMGSPIPNGCLLNGLNQRDCSSLPNRMCDNSTATIPSLGLTANANHRLRFINVGAFAWFQVAVDEHNFAVTEVDGTNVLPSYESSLMVSPGQRYSMVLRTNQTTSDSFWLRARMVSYCWNKPMPPGHPAAEVQAILRYTSSGQIKATEKGLVARPTSRDTNPVFAAHCKDMDTTSYKPASHQPAPELADHTYYIDSKLAMGAGRLERGTFNGHTYRADLKKPTLHQTVEGLSSGNQTFASMISTDGVNGVSYNKNDYLIQHSGIKVVDLIIQNWDEGNHPMHLHGHKLWVLGQGEGKFPGYHAIGLKSAGRGVLAGHEGGLDNLVQRDVATLQASGWMALRFVADNPGIWAFHCHMAWHDQAGLAMQFLDRVDEVVKWVIPEQSINLCEASLQELEKGAAPKDSQWLSGT